MSTQVVRKTPPAHGDVLTAISEGMVGLLKEFYGRGPTRTKTYYADDLVVCLLRGGFSRVEQTLLDGGRGASVIRQRMEFQELMRERFEDVIESATGRRVIGFMSGNQQGPDIMCEVFILAPTDLVDDHEIPGGVGSVPATRRDFPGSPTLEVAVPDPDSIARRAAALRPFVCSSTGGGLGAAWVHVAGALDIATSPQLERMLVESPARLVVLDMRDLGFMDCSGVHTIVDASVRARRDGRRLILLRGTPNVDRIFSLTGSSDEVEIGDLDVLEPPGQLHLKFADETLLIP